MPKTIRISDLFCGAGGSSTGSVLACKDLGYNVELTAINHWDLAIATHSENHAQARHFCASLDTLKPSELYKEGELDILWASPACTHHSIARGGKPMNDQSRATAWCVVRWAEELRPPVILVENVPEFEKWGPLGSDGRPLKSGIGKIFQSWVDNLRAIGYRVEWRVLCAADYGDPTTRRRLFIYAVRGRRKIVWPEPSHAPRASSDLFGKRKQWVAAKEIIDWEIPGKSIFGRKKPLADKTLRRILIGLEKFGGVPFICGAGGPARSGEPQSVENPVGTVLTKNDRYLAQPFIIGQFSGSSPRSVDDPLPTVTTTSRGVGLAKPYLVHLRGTNKAQVEGSARPITDPLPSLTAGGGHVGLCEPYLVQTNHGNGKDKNGDKRRVRPTTQPLPTVAGNRGEWSLCQPFILPHPRPKGDGPISVDKPMPTVTATSSDFGLVEPYLVKFYGNSNAAPINQPLDSVTTKERFGLCQPIVEIDGERYLLDIHFRMLKPQELAGAQGFPKGYRFRGNASEVVKQIGNAVCVNLSRALVKAALSQQAS